MDEAELRVRSDVDTYGWHVAKIGGDDRAPPWAFTIGLEQSFGHPEVLVFGMELELLHALLNQIGELVKHGRSFDPGERADGLLEQNPPEFRSVDPRWQGAFTGNAAWFYRERSFRVLQCFWPDSTGRMPWRSSTTWKEHSVIRASRGF